MMSDRSKLVLSAFTPVLQLPLPRQGRSWWRRGKGARSQQLPILSDCAPRLGNAASDSVLLETSRSYKLVLRQLRGFLAQVPVATPEDAIQLRLHLLTLRDSELAALERDAGKIGSDTGCMEVLIKQHEIHQVEHFAAILVKKADRFHNRHRAFFPELVRLADKAAAIEVAAKKGKEECSAAHHEARERFLWWDWLLSRVSQTIGYSALLMLCVLVPMAVHCGLTSTRLAADALSLSAVAAAKVDAAKATAAAAAVAAAKSKAAGIASFLAQCGAPDMVAIAVASLLAWLLGQPFVPAFVDAGHVLTASIEARSAAADVIQAERRAVAAEGIATAALAYASFLRDWCMRVTVILVLWLLDYAGGGGLKHLVVRPWRREIELQGEAAAAFTAVEARFRRMSEGLRHADVRSEALLSSVDAIREVAESIRDTAEDAKDLVPTTRAALLSLHQHKQDLLGLVDRLTLVGRCLPAEVAAMRRDVRELLQGDVHDCEVTAGADARLASPPHAGHSGGPVEHRLCAGMQEPEPLEATMQPDDAAGGTPGGAQRLSRVETSSCAGSSSTLDSAAPRNGLKPGAPPSCTGPECAHESAPSCAHVEAPAGLPSRPTGRGWKSITLPSPMSRVRRMGTRAWGLFSSVCTCQCRAGRARGGDARVAAGAPTRRSRERRRARRGAP